MAGGVGEAQMAGFLTAPAVRKPTVAEITGAARPCARRCRRWKRRRARIDLVGTGGDGHGTLNISTAASFVAAACGVPVAKHGNRNCPRAPAPRMCWKPWASRSTCRPKPRAGLHRKCGHVFPVRADPPSGDEACGARAPRDSAFAPFSICWGRWPTRRGSSASCVGVFALEWMEPCRQSAGLARGRKGLGGAWP